VAIKRGIFAEVKHRTIEIQFAECKVDARLPPGDRLWVGEVQIRALAEGPRLNVGVAVRRTQQEATSSCLLETGATGIEELWSSHATSFKPDMNVATWWRSSKSASGGRGLRSTAAASPYLIVYRSGRPMSATGLEQVVGRVGHRKSSFALDSSATMESDTLKATWFVVSGV
jgi:hypothetical protein